MLKVGLIGSGNIARKRHAPAWQKLAGQASVTDAANTAAADAMPEDEVDDSADGALEVGKETGPAVSTAGEDLPAIDESDDAGKQPGAHVEDTAAGLANASRGDAATNA